MPKEVLHTILTKFRVRYKNAVDKKHKGTILTEFCETFDYSRKHAMTLLRKPPNKLPGGSGPPVKYGPSVVIHLRNLWEATGRICSVRLKAAIPIWLDYYTDPSCDTEIAKLLCEISPSTIDRLLRPYRRALKGKSSTQPSAYLKNKIPMEVLDSKVKGPGTLQADTVAHCGNSLRGLYANTLTVTDLFSGWTENRATWTKTAEQVLEQLKDIRKTLPFYVREFASDNGSEFINSAFVKYFENNIDPGQVPIQFKRSRPYKKNDQCYVEQKNDTHVRNLFGYDRYDHEELVSIMNDIYKNAWNPLQNLFLPNMKLIKKTRIGGKIKKVYDTPKTPYQRVMESERVPEFRKELLKLEKEKLNPIVLQAILEEKLKIFRKEFQKAKSLAVEIERKSA